MPPPPPAPLLRADDLCHRGAPPEELRGVSLAVEERRFTLISGSPGSGAGLLLRILGLLEKPESGEVLVDSQRVGVLDDAARLHLRNHAFGFVFAEPFLLESFSVVENVAMPLLKISGLDIEQARIRTAGVLDFAGLAAAAELPVSELTTLDRHKVSLARALSIAPRVLIAEDLGLQLSADDLPSFAALLRSAPDLLGVSVIATCPSGPGFLNPDREIRLEHGLVAADSDPIPIPQSATRDLQ